MLVRFVSPLIVLLRLMLLLVALFSALYSSVLRSQADSQALLSHVVLNVWSCLALYLCTHDRNSVLISNFHSSS